MKQKHNPFDLGTPEVKGYKITNTNTMKTTQMILKEFDKQFKLIDDLDWDRDLQEEVKSFIRQTLTQQLDELKGKVEGVRVESARTCSSEDTDEYRAYDAGEEAMRNKILTLIDSMK